MAILTSYDLKGQKDSFANWISNLSPTDTFFVSTTKKEQVTNTLFQWQT
ncbi:MAG: SU10 major capsid protein, partial [Bacteroidales bacterium]